MTTLDRIKNYLSRRSTPATSAEIAKYAKLNYKTVKNVLAINNGKEFTYGPARKCKASGSPRVTYGLM